MNKRLDNLICGIFDDGLLCTSWCNCGETFDNTFEVGDDEADEWDDRNGDWSDSTDEEDDGIKFNWYETITL